MHTCNPRFYCVEEQTALLYTEVNVKAGTWNVAMPDVIDEFPKVEGLEKL